MSPLYEEIDLNLLHYNSTDPFSMECISRKSTLSLNINISFIFSRLYLEPVNYKF